MTCIRNKQQHPRRPTAGMHLSEMKIISVSRRTDIPAFYGKWFMKRIADGFAGYTNPYNNRKYIVSLKKEDVASIVLWSKNFSPFIDNALILKKEGFPLFFNYTITGLPQIFEPQAPSENESIDSVKFLSGIFSPDHINWRYDPILVSEITDINYHAEKFNNLCNTLSGYIKRCYISFPTAYGKVDRSFKKFTEDTDIPLIHPALQQKIDLADKLSGIAEVHGIKIYSCCGDYLASNKLEKGRCIDRKILSSIANKDLSALKTRPTRKECGCTESIDIGVYDTCPHGCIYCYANINTVKALSFYKRYISDDGYSESAFLGESKNVSDEMVKTISSDNQIIKTEAHIQQLLFE